MNTGVLNPRCLFDHEGLRVLISGDEELESMAFPVGRHFHESFELPEGFDDPMAVDTAMLLILKGKIDLPLQQYTSPYELQQGPIPQEETVAYFTTYQALQHRSNIWAMVTTSSINDVFNGKSTLDWSAYPYAVQFDRLLSGLNHA